MARTLVTGASGRIGSHLVQQLLLADVELRVLCQPRDPAVTGLRGLGVEVVEAFLEDREAVAAALRGIDDVFHLGAALTTRGVSPVAVVDSIVRGTFNVIEGAKVSGRQPRLVLTSSTSVYYSGYRYPYGPRPCDETMPIAPSTPYGAAKRSAELLVELAVREGWCRGAIVRPSDTASTEELVNPHSVFGRRWFIEGATAFYEANPPGTADRVSRHVYDQIAPESTKALFYLVDAGGTQLPIQISDAASVARFLIAQMEAVEADVPFYANAVARLTWPMGDFVREIAEKLGVGAEEVVRVEADTDAADRWLFGTKHDTTRPADAVTVLRESAFPLPRTTGPTDQGR